MMQFNYAGDCNSGSKTIAINLPNDDKSKLKKSTTPYNYVTACKQNLDKILMPIGKMIVEPQQQQHLKFDAFFWNVTFHGGFHGLGIKKKTLMEKALSTKP